jgi:RND family efflux transporter MFP subunit
MKKSFIRLLAMAVMAVGCSGQKAQEQKAPTRVKTELAAPADSRVGQSYVGVVEEREATAVSFTSMGVVRRMLVSEGQTVQRGQLLAEIDDTQARSLLQGAEAAMSQANDALERYGMLHDNGSLPEAQWVEIQSKVAQARSQLEVAKKNLADCRLTAPVSGIIGKKQVGVGETALPSQAVVTIFDVSTVKVKVAVPEAELSAIDSNTPSIIRVEAAGKQVAGGRIEKGVVADAQTHTYDLRIHVANPERRLLPGMVANVQLKTASSTSQGCSIQVPVTAVQKRTDGTLFVWTVDAQKKARRTAVTIGPVVGNHIGISSGLEAGQRVVVEGYQKLSEGTEVLY